VDIHYSFWKQKETHHRVNDQKEDGVSPVDDKKEIATRGNGVMNVTSGFAWNTEKS